MSQEKAMGLLLGFEAMADMAYRSVPVPHPNLYISRWCLVAAIEDYGRLYLSGLLDAPAASIEYQIDRSKYSMKFGLQSINEKSKDLTVSPLPRKIIDALMIRAVNLMNAGLMYIHENQVCSAAHSGSVEIIEEDDGDTLRISYDLASHQEGYGALEMLGHVESGDIPHTSSFYAWSKKIIPVPAIVEVIAGSVRLKGGRIEYEYLPNSAIMLAAEMSQQSYIIPAEWEFPWGGRREITVLLNALSVRCLYHLVAICFGAARYSLRGAGAASVLLTLNKEQLVKDIELMSSLPISGINSFIEYMTYGGSMRNPDPALQPLIGLGSNRFAIPCIHWLSSNLERNILSLEARVRKKYFDSKSNVFEGQMLARLKESLMAKWENLRINTFPLGRSGEEIDLLVADPGSRTLVCCEMRWMLQPGDPREVQDKTAACFEKVKQAARKLDWAQANIENILDRSFGIALNAGQSWRVTALVVIETYAGVKSDVPHIPIVPASIFDHCMKIFERLDYMHEWLCSLGWLPQKDIHFAMDDNAYKLGGKNIILPGMNILVGRTKYLEDMENAARNFRPSSDSP